MKIENYSGTADTFTFAHNPNTFDDELNKFLDRRDLPYSFTFLGTTTGLKSRRLLTLTGHFDGTNRLSDYRTLLKHTNDYQIKKVYWATDKWYLAMGITTKKTPVGTRPNHIDYISSWLSPLGVLFGDSKKSGDESSVQQNSGDAFTPFHKISGTVTASSQVTIQDNAGNGIKFTPTDSGTADVYLVKQTTEDNEVYITEWIYAEIGSTKQVISSASPGTSQILGLEPSQSIGNLFSGGTISNISSMTFEFYDGWHSE